MISAAEENFPMLAYFAFAHLPAHLQGISRPFADLATATADRFLAKNTNALTRGRDYEETTAAIRKLLEAKDCAVRAML